MFIRNDILDHITCNADDQKHDNFEVQEHTNTHHFDSLIDQISENVIPKMPIVHHNSINSNKLCNGHITTGSKYLTRMEELDESKLLFSQNILAVNGIVVCNECIIIAKHQKETDKETHPIKNIDSVNTTDSSTTNANQTIMQCHISASELKLRHKYKLLREIIRKQQIAIQNIKKEYKDLANNVNMLEGKIFEAMNIQLQYNEIDHY